MLKLISFIIENELATSHPISTGCNTDVFITQKSNLHKHHQKSNVQLSAGSETVQTSNKSSKDSFCIDLLMMNHLQSKNVGEIKLPILTLGFFRDLIYFLKH